MSFLRLSRIVALGSVRNNAKVVVFLPMVTRTALLSIDLRMFRIDEAGLS